MVAPPRFFLENISDGIATDRNQLNNDVSTLVTPTRSGLENEIIDFNISGDMRSHQLIKSAQDDEKTQSSNSDQQIVPSIKVSRLERTVDSICKMQIEFPCQANACVIEKLQKDLNFNKKSSELYHRLV